MNSQLPFNVPSLYKMDKHIFFCETDKKKIKEILTLISCCSLDYYVILSSMLGKIF